MPIPFLIAAAAIAAGAAGVGLGAHGAMKMKEANDTLKSAEERNKKNNMRLEMTNKSTCETMDVLGKNEMEVLAGFSEFSDLFEKIKNRPKFANININDTSIPEFDGEDVKKASVGASVLVGGLGGAALGTAGGFAASGATTAAVMALGTASTGTAISALGGAAATNATLAVLGGGTLAAGGGGVALGTTVLGAATLGVGLLVGGAIFSLTGSKLSDKADEAYWAMRRNEDKINNLCSYLNELQSAAMDYNLTLTQTRSLYNTYLNRMRFIIKAHESSGVNWHDFSESEKLVVNNEVLLVTVLYNMCKVQLVLKPEEESECNIVNQEEIAKASQAANNAFAKVMMVA